MKDLIRRHCERNNIPQLTAKNLYGVDRDLQFRVEVYRENRWSLLGEKKRVRVDTVPISRNNVSTNPGSIGFTSTTNSKIVLCVLMNRGVESFRRALVSWHETKLLDLVSAT